MGRWMKKIKNKQYGQAMVEFALTLPIFLLAVIGVIELSRFFLVYSSVYTASREAARYGTSVGEDKNLPNYVNCSEIALRAQQSGFFGGVNASDVIIYYESTPGTKLADCGSYDPILGDRLVVEVAAEYKPLIVGLVLPDGMMVSAKNGRTIMNEIEMVITPIIPPTCTDMLNDIVITKPPTKYDNKTVYIDIKNKSPNLTYQLVEVTNIQWTDTNGRELSTVGWGNLSDVIWSGISAPPVNIVETDFKSTLNRNLPANQTKRVYFGFTKNANNVGLTFNIKFRFLGWDYQECPIVY
ncbi:MAG: hypothetical protein CVU41_16470 [Chloroflexi bacterium HGW-Chloroflexi-3]|nr:MAG: hypothetical protein CVU41_16470 [Chloroflexi bacterium HGW-Chloroflexi-3]